MAMDKPAPHPAPTPPGNEPVPPKPVGRGRDPLSEKQKRFCAEYSLDLNATEAYLRAYGRYHNRDGKRRATAYRNATYKASRLLRKANIQSEIKRLQRAKSARTRVTADRIIAELAGIGFGDIGDLLDPKTNNALPMNRVPPHARKLIQEASVEETVNRDGSVTTRRKIKLKSSEKALATLAKHFGLLRDEAAILGLLKALPDDLRGQVMQHLGLVAPDAS
jgi:phage terminase small subunit